MLKTQSLLIILRWFPHGVSTSMVRASNRLGLPRATIPPLLPFFLQLQRIGPEDQDGLLEGKP